MTHWDAVGVFLADALSFCLALLEGVLVLELGSHDGDSYAWFRELFEGGCRYCSRSVEVSWSWEWRLKR